MGDDVEELSPAGEMWRMEEAGRLMSNERMERVVDRGSRKQRPKRERVEALGEGVLF